MTMREWYVEFEFYNDKASPDTYAGKLTNGDVDNMIDDAELTTDEWWQKHGSPSN